VDRWIYLSQKTIHASPSAKYWSTVYPIRKFCFWDEMVSPLSLAVLCFRMTLLNRTPTMNSKIWRTFFLANFKFLSKNIRCWKRKTDDFFYWEVMVSSVMRIYRISPLYDGVLLISNYRYFRGGLTGQYQDFQNQCHWNYTFILNRGPPFQKSGRKVPFFIDI